MKRDYLFEVVGLLEGEKGFTREGAILRQFIIEHTTKSKTPALFKPKEPIVQVC